jgi:hypothetical protein
MVINEKEYWQGEDAITFHAFDKLLCENIT